MQGLGHQKAKNCVAVQMSQPASASHRVDVCLGSDAVRPGMSSRFAVEGKGASLAGGEDTGTGRLKSVRSWRGGIMVFATQRE